MELTFYISIPLIILIIVLRKLYLAKYKKLRYEVMFRWKEGDRIILDTFLTGYYFGYYYGFDVKTDTVLYGEHSTDLRYLKQIKLSAFLINKDYKERKDRVITEAIIERCKYLDDIKETD